MWSIASIHSYLETLQASNVFNLCAFTATPPPHPTAMHDISRPPPSRVCAHYDNAQRGSAVPGVFKKRENGQLPSKTQRRTGVARHISITPGIKPPSSPPPHRSQRPSNSIISRAELLVRNSVGQVVRRAAKTHGNDTSVTTEVSALLKTLGMDPLGAEPLTQTLVPSRLMASSPERCLRRAYTTRKAMAGVLVDVEVETKVCVL